MQLYKKFGWSCDSCWRDDRDDDSIRPFVLAGCINSTPPPVEGSDASFCDSDSTKYFSARVTLIYFAYGFGGIHDAVLENLALWCGFPRPGSGMNLP